MSIEIRPFWKIQNILNLILFLCVIYIPFVLVHSVSHGMCYLLMEKITYKNETYIIMTEKIAAFSVLLSSMSFSLFYLILISVLFVTSAIVNYVYIKCL